MEQVQSSQKRSRSQEAEHDSSEEDDAINATREIMRNKKRVVRYTFPLRGGRLAVEYKKAIDLAFGYILNQEHDDVRIKSISIDADLDEDNDEMVNLEIFVTTRK
jgi:hypothetical protein